MFYIFTHFELNSNTALICNLRLRFLWSSTLAPDSSPIHLRLLLQCRFKPCLGLVHSCYGQKIVCYRTACCWLRLRSMDSGFRMCGNLVYMKDFAICTVSAHWFHFCLSNWATGFDSKHKQLGNTRLLISTLDLNILWIYMRVQNKTLTLLNLMFKTWRSIRTEIGDQFSSSPSYLK